ncbi:hypothetical protein [Niallia sp. 03133]|uniref:hypothetical protein n=1 Tax=Niallia sp. 03133 TaxID=3458060 RepID=UPI004044939D
MEQNKKDIFTTELKTLLNNQYITTSVYDLVLHAYHHFYEEKKIKIEAEVSLKTQTVQKAEEKPQKIKEKKIHTKEELREKNIGFLLYIGVFFLLLGGMFVATSNWDSMEGWMKAGSIFLVSIVFYSFAVFAKNIVKIEKTAFAFFVLGSFFLPIGMISVSWFELLGHFLSLRGEGNYILGVIGTGLLIPLYFYLANFLQSAFFRIVTLAAFSTMIAFLLLSFHPSKDLFFFFFIGFNSCMILLLSKYKENMWVTKMAKELPIYTQVHLLLTTICLAFLYNSAVFQGINFILLGVLYMGILYETKYKHYHIFVTLMIVIGCYRIMTIDLMYVWSPMFFAIVALFIMLIGFILKGGSINWGKTWEISSAIVICMLFVYCQFFYMDFDFKGSIILAITYLMIAGQFTFLANKLPYRFFEYTPAAFSGLSLFQIALKMNLITSLPALFIVLYSIGFVLFGLLGFLNRTKFFEKIKYSSAVIGLSLMLSFACFTGMFYLGEWYACCLFLLLGFILMLVKKEKWPVCYLPTLPYFIPCCFAAAYLAFFEAIPMLEMKGTAFVIACSSVTLLATKAIFSNKDLLINRISFFIGQGMYLLAILLTASEPPQVIWIRTCIYTAGLLVFLAFYKAKKDWMIIWLVSIMVPITYLSFIRDLFHVSLTMQIKWNTYGWILFFVLQWMVNKTPFKRSFFIIAHMYLLISISADYLVNGNSIHMHFLIALLAYMISAFMIKHNIVNSLFHYACYCCFLLYFASSINKGFAGGSPLSQAFILTSILVFFVNMLIHKGKKTAVVYFFYPLSIIGIGSWIAASNYTAHTYTVGLCYIALYLIYTYLSKRHYFQGAGLILLLACTERFHYSQKLIPFDQFLLYSILGIMLIFIGSYAYKTLYCFGEKKGNYIDFYSVTGIIFFLLLYKINGYDSWATILPGLLIAGSLFIQKGRMPKNIGWIPVMSAVLYLLQPYYALLKLLPIPYYLSEETIVLPWVILIIISKKIVKGIPSKMVNRAEWVVLIIASMLLIVDALQTATIFDAIILGSLSLLSVVCGFYFKYKSYFFIGIIVLLLNVLLQTRPFWGNFPWWAYLLIAGSLLIVIASYYEWQKQKNGEKIMLKFVDWKSKIKNNLSKWQ